MKDKKTETQQLPLFEHQELELIKQERLPETFINTQERFSDYVVYVDESGDHSLKSIDEKYPIFVLAFCVFHKRHYSEEVISSLEKLKFNYFGHDQVILHEHEIRKEKGAFNIFRSREHKLQFISDLSAIIDHSNFILISCVVDKRQLTASLQSQNPYHIAMRHCLEMLYELMREKEQEQATTHIVFESRGQKEDKDLELEFHRVCAGENKNNQKLPFVMLFSDKKAMSSGLQLADLVARPIGLHVLRPEQNNQAYNILTKKFFCSGGREQLGKDFKGLGLKIIPS